MVTERFLPRLFSHVLPPLSAIGQVYLGETVHAFWRQTYSAAQREISNELTRTGTRMDVANYMLSYCTATVLYHKCFCLHSALSKP